MEIALYIEGGGSPEQRAALRQGFDKLVSAQKERARERRIGWKSVFCGSRDLARNHFLNAIKTSGQTTCILVVDSEGPVDAGMTPKDFLRRPPHNWHLQDAPPDSVHLMVECMEAWIVADREAVATYFGQHFNGNCLPGHNDLEAVSKAQVQTALANATRQTSKGEYKKGRDDSILLACIDPNRVRERCPHFRALTAFLDQIIAGAP